MITQKQFDKEYLLMMYEQKSGEIHRAENAIHNRRVYLRKRGIDPRRDDQLALLNYGMYLQRQALAAINESLMALGVQMEITRPVRGIMKRRQIEREKERRVMERRQIEREKERRVMERMMRGNYHRYDGEDV